jgi:hypothetical protein
MDWVYGSDKEKSKILTRTNLYNKLYIAILNDYTRYQAEPGNAYPEALPPYSGPRQSLWTSVPRQSLEVNQLLKLI